MSENNWRISVQVGDGMISREMNNESCEKKQKRKGRKKRKIISENHNNVSSRSSSLSCTKLRPSFYSRPRVLGRRHTRREERREKNVNMREQVIDLHVVLQQVYNKNYFLSTSSSDLEVIL